MKQRLFWGKTGKGYWLYLFINTLHGKSERILIKLNSRELSKKIMQVQVNGTSQLSRKIVQSNRKVQVFGLTDECA